MDRINYLIKKVKQATANLPAEKAAKLHKQLDMNFEEFCVYQALKSLAQANGKISLDEANSIHVLLGSTPEYFNAQPLATKIALTEILAALLKIK